MEPGSKQCQGFTVVQILLSASLVMHSANAQVSQASQACWADSHALQAGPVSAQPCSWAAISISREFLPAR